MGQLSPPLHRQVKSSAYEGFESENKRGKSQCPVTVFSSNSPTSPIGEKAKACQSSPGQRWREGFLAGIPASAPERKNPDAQRRITLT